MNNKTTNVRYLAQLALLAAIEVVMKLMGLGSVPVGPLYMSFLTVPIAVGAMSAPLLNTIFFMGYIVLVFYKTDYIQERVASLGVANPLSFVVALVGVQGLIEIIVGCAVGGVLARAVASFLGHRAPAKAE